MREVNAHRERSISRQTNAQTDRRLDGQMVEIRHKHLQRQIKNEKRGMGILSGHVCWQELCSFISFFLIICLLY